MSSLPIPPSRADPANFSERADAFLGALPAWSDNLEILYLAAAAGAFQGAWDAGTEYAAGMAVSHEGIAYVSLQDENSGNEPGAAPEWWLNLLGSKLNSAHPVLTAGTLREVEYTIADAAGFEIDPANGSMQNVTLGANRAPKATYFLDGHAITLRVKDGSGYTLDLTDATFGSGGIAWMGDPPSLDSSDWTVIVMWKEDGQVYGRDAGVVA
jgi:hypothetical protein